MGDAAARAAEEVELIRLSAEGFDAFMASLEGPPAIVPEIVTLVSRSAPWEGAAADDRIDAARSQHRIAVDRARLGRQRHWHRTVQARASAMRRGSRADRGWGCVP